MTCWPSTCNASRPATNGAVRDGRIEQPHKNGSMVISEVVASFLFDDEGRPTSILGIARDDSGRRAAEAQLRAANARLRQQLQEIEQLQGALQEQAIRDSLTGCFNRRYLDETLERELSRARREGYPLSLLILDLDLFKQINDSYGHLAGDEALRELASHLSADIRQEDVLCRYGGEEFVILMPRMPLAVAASGPSAGVRRSPKSGALRFLRTALHDLGRRGGLSRPCPDARRPDASRRPGAL